MKVTVKFIGLVVFCIVWTRKCDGGPVDKKKLPNFPDDDQLKFMKKYGYLVDDDGESEALYTHEGISEVIKTVQRFGAIEETGVIDNATIKLMSSPRCGVKDVIKGKRSKRYILGPSGWNKRTITYFIANWSPKLGEEAVAKNIQLALNTWGQYGRLTFQRTNTPNADIIVAFARGYHGDVFPFDGPGNVLAHAYFPYEMDGYGGDIHFDDDENWVDGDDSDGTDFLSVALHELGHSLGLAHSISPSAIMFPYYRGYDSNKRLQLDYDDILGIYELYIRRNLDGDNQSTRDDEYDYDTSSGESSTSTTTEHTTESYWTPTTSGTRPTESYYTSSTRRPYYPTTTPTWTTEDNNSTVSYDGDMETVDDHKNHDTTHNIPSTSTPSLPNICDGNFDAVATLRNELFIFKDQYIWRLQRKGRIMPGYPIPLSNMFPFPKEIKKIDAAYERSDGSIILFTGNTYWVYTGNGFIEGSPRPITDYGLPHTLDSVDAVQVWEKNRKTYIYKNDRFWRYNETAKRMDPGYPRHMNVWRNIPENLDAATTWTDGITYFFKKDLYWTFDNDWIVATENSPLPAAQMWLGCAEDVHQMRRFME